MARLVLPSWLRAALPEPLRGSAHVVSQRQGSLVMGLGPVNAPRHVIEMSLVTRGRPSLLRLGTLDFGYREAASRRGQGHEQRFCKALAATLHKQLGDRLAAFVAEGPPAQAERDSEEVGEGAKLTVSETALIRRGIEPTLARLREHPGPIAYLEFFLASACNQSCGFCVFPKLRGTAAQLPPSPDIVEWAGVLLGELDARPGRTQLTLSGPDCLSHPRFDALLELVIRYPDLDLELLGPMTGLADPAVAERVLSVPNLTGIHTTLLSHRAEVHDAIVGRAGAHADVLAVLDHCLTRGISISLNDVLCRDNIADLPDLLGWLAPFRGVDIQLLLYHPETQGELPNAWRELELSRLVIGPDELLGALANVRPALLRSVHARLLPHCWVPPHLREVLLLPMEDLQDNFTQPPACASCPAQNDCPGLTVPAFESLGAKAARPLAEA